METSRIAPALCGLAGAIYLLAPAHTRAFEVFGDVLDLSQRDFRFLNGFTGTFANANQIPDPDYPGALGAELAIRKGVAEWGSQAHGSGLTDPTQDAIGSGGSNFDAFFSGRSTIAGGPNGNIISVIPGSSPGVFAFTELPIGDGWRIRFYDQSAEWNDAVSPPLQGVNALDIQGVMTHEYGHALGLDHSMIPGATMGVTTADRGIDLRSIEDDDIAGVRFLYGDRSPLKPTVTRYSLAGSQVTLHGAGFHPTDNEVWLTHAAPTTTVNGTPVIAQGLPSAAGGTEITFALPAGAGPGDIAVRVPGTGPEFLSNVQPFDPLTEAWTPPVRYGAAGISSAGTPVRIEWLELPSVTRGSVRFSVSGGDGTAPGNVGLLVTGTSRTSLTTPHGTLLVGGALRRASLISLFFGAGIGVLDLAPTPMIGARIQVQAWIPDRGPSGGVLSDALELELTP